LDLLKPCEWAIPKERKSKARNKISSLAIITAERPEECLRAFASYDANLQLHSRPATMIVMDDSKLPNDLKNRLRKHSVPSGREVRYAGRAEKLAYIEGLSRAGIDSNIARFAILGDIHLSICSIGANRNALLLDTIGENVLSADDDTICKLRGHPAPATGCKLQCSGNPRDSWFYSNRDEIVAEDRWTDHDLLHEHGEMLGESAAAMIQGAGGQVEADQLCSDLLYALQAGSSMIRVTMSGVIGDSGAYCSNWVLWLDGPSRRRIGEDELLFRTALNSRETFGVVPVPTIDHSGFCASTTMALNNTEILPPFLPIGRNEDGMFGTLLRMTSCNSFVGHVPFAVFHSPSNVRQYVKMPDFRLSDLFLSLFARTHSSDHMTVSTLLRRIGRDLIEISILPAPELSEVIAQAVYEREAKRIAGTFSFTRSLPYQGPPFFEEEFAKYRVHLLRATTNEAFRFPVEFSAAFGGAAHQKMKELLSLTGQFFCSWPDIVDAAAQLNRAGQRMTKML
jgi:hypothetical protein